jgi:hypothetical protein
MIIDRVKWERYPSIELGGVVFYRGRYKGATAFLCKRESGEVAGYLGGLAPCCIGVYADIDQAFNHLEGELYANA